MRNKKLKITFMVLGLLLIVTFIIIRMKGGAKTDEITKEINPSIGSIQAFISTTGTVLPKNRLEVKPPIGGRAEKILVREGEKVKTGQIIAWMSSTERAALIDAARAKGEEAVKYWEQIYKPISLVSPIDGEVIVAKTQPGQTITSSDAVVVLSDHLIARAQVDETDIGKIKLAQEAIITLDAYPDTKIKGKVEHIYYESKTVNNVTIYEVDVIPNEVLPFFRSGMNAEINFIEKSSANTLLLPIEAVHQEKEKNYVLIKENANSEPLKRDVEVGISDDKNVEIISGITAQDKVMVKTKKYVIPKSELGKNPFMPFGQRRREQSKEK